MQLTSLAYAVNCIRLRSYSRRDTKLTASANEVNRIYLNIFFLPNK
jgi:hypothetical protein